MFGPKRLLDGLEVNVRPRPDATVPLRATDCENRHWFVGGMAVVRTAN